MSARQHLHVGYLPDAPLLHPLPHDGLGLRCPSACPPRLHLRALTLLRKAGVDVQAHARGTKPAELRQLTETDAGQVKIEGAACC